MKNKFKHALLPFFLLLNHKQAKKKMANHAKPTDSNSMFCAFPRKEFEVLAFSAMPVVKQMEKKL